MLREPNYRRLFFGRTVSLVGDGIAPVAIAFAILDLTGSATDLGIVFAAHSLLITALVLVGGVFADRISPRLSMLRAVLVRTAAMGAIAALLIAGVAEIWQLAVLYAIEGAATAFFNPASNDGHRAADPARGALARRRVRLVRLAGAAANRPPRRRTARRRHRNPDDPLAGRGRDNPLPGGGPLRPLGPPPPRRPAA